MNRIRHPRALVVAAVALVVAPRIWAGASIFDVASTSSSADFNGSSIGSDGFGVLVGDGGTIVHRSPDGTLSEVPSNTDLDLFDVFVVDASTAVATGRGIVLRWDGDAWSTLVEDPGEAVFTSVWVAPQKDVAVYNVPGQQFSFHTSYDLIADEPAGPSAVSGFDIAYCGQSNDIKSVVRNGSIQNFNNTLAPTAGTESTFGVLFDNNASPLNLTAAWIPSGACIDGPALPLWAYAIDSSRFFYRFDQETGWSLMPVDGGSIPGDHTLTWIAGAGPELVYATGFKPDGNGGFVGVIWRWDGQLWREQTLPPDSPGLADIDIELIYSDVVFDSSFEPVGMAKTGTLGPGSEVNLLAAAEEGRVLSFSEQARVFENVADIEALEKRLITGPPYEEGTQVTYEFSVRNNSSTQQRIHVSEFLLTVRDGFAFAAVRLVSSTCGLSQNPRAFSAVFGYVELGAGEVLNCEVTLRLEAPDLDELRNTVRVSVIGSGFVDPNPTNNEVRADVVLQ